MQLWFNLLRFYNQILYELEWVVWRWAMKLETQSDLGKQRVMYMHIS